MKEERGGGLVFWRIQHRRTVFICDTQDISTLESSQKKKKKSSPQSPDTAMDLLKAITSPLAAGAKSSKKAGEKSSSSSSHPESRKEHHKKKGNGSSGELSLDDSNAHKSKKMKPLYVNTETLTLREPDGLKMKLILSPKEKGSSSVEEEAFSTLPNKLR